MAETICFGIEVSARIADRDGVHPWSIEQIGAYFDSYAQAKTELDRLSKKGWDVFEEVEKMLQDYLSRSGDWIIDRTCCPSFNIVNLSFDED
jgi:hypothetical protein